MEQPKKGYYDVSSERYTIEDFYALPDDKRCELINGVLYDMAPPMRVHQRLVSLLVTSINNYIDKNNGDCEVNPAPFGVQLNENEDTIVEPDISVICDKDKLTEHGCVGAPDWVIEIVSPSNPSHDYLKKLVLYMDAGVREYWIVDPGNQRITIYGGEQPFIPEPYSFDDEIKVGIYDDFAIDFKEISKKL